MYSHAEVLESCLKYFNGDELAATATVTKYLMRNDDGNYLEKNPDDYLRNRIVPEFTRIENKYQNPLSYDQIYNALEGYKKVYCAGSPTYAIGNNQKISSAANCFFVGAPADSIGSILRKDEELAQICKRRGGVGTDISTIRPQGMKVNNAAGTTDGVIVFLERYSNTIKGIAQNGRRGAGIVSMNCRHPEIRQFITVKHDLSKVTGMNISVKWTNDFFKALERKQKFTLQFPVDVPLEDALYVEEVDAVELWNLFCDSAHKSAEPGCLYWDNIIDNSLSDCYAGDGFKTQGTNPCGEIFLSEYGSCILMGLNLYGFVQNPYTDSAYFDFEDFNKHVGIASRLIDDLVDIEIEKTDMILTKIENDIESEDDKATEYRLWRNIKRTLELGRRTGLGVTGLADMLAALNIKYDSDNAIEMCDKVFSEFHNSNMKTQSILARERGAFGCWDWEKEKNNPYIKNLPLEIQLMVQDGRRNISTTTIAPVGTISLLTQTSSGIEPVFQLDYTRRKKLSLVEEQNGIPVTRVDSDGIKWTEFKVYHHGVKRWMDATGETDITKSPYWGCTSGDIDWQLRVRLQGMINTKYITHSISSTINLPSSTTVETISEIYLAGWKYGCRGLTVYRDGSREGVLVSTEPKRIERPTKITTVHAPKRPDVLPCHIHQSVIKGNRWIIFVSMLDDMPYEILGGRESAINIPKKYIKANHTENAWVIKEYVSGKTIYSLVVGSLDDSEDRQKFTDIANIFDSDKGSPTRLISALLRHGMRIFDICEQLHKIPQEDSMFTFEAGVRRVLKKYIIDNTKTKSKCQECEGIMIYENGCVKCPQCGWTKCE
jgi:ribonucleoside-diphosphate reductase alpha chain